jgi:hypothetical protein
MVLPSTTWGITELALLRTLRKSAVLSSTACKLKHKSDGIKQAATE